MYAIEINNVVKGFKKHYHKRHFLTLKSTLIRDIWRLRKKKKEEREDLFYALRGVTFNVEKGKTVGIIGSNGSGKSTLLKIIAGILKPTAGTVKVRGKLSALIELGAGFHPEISGRENIFINGIMLGLSKKEIKEKFDEIVDFAELREFIDNPVKTYSSGMYMRLGFSVAINVNPDVLLIDEVLAVGDQSFVHKCLDKIYGFKRAGKTIVFVSHNMDAVASLCDEAVWLNEGIVMERGEPRRVIDSYLLYVAKKEEEKFKKQHTQIQRSINVIESSQLKNTKKLSVEQLQSSTTEFSKRWGSMEVEIVKVEILDKNNNAKNIFQTGDKVKIKIHFKCKKRVKEPVFGIGIYLGDGTWCYGSNTYIERIKIKEIKDEGWVEVAFNSLNLVPGDYYIDVAVHAKNGYPYDYHSRLYKIGFRSNINDYGIYRPSHTWNFSPNLPVTYKK